MKKTDSNDKNKIGRRSFLPLLGGGLLLPFMGYGKAPSAEKDEDFQTLLKPDGTTVRVKNSIVSKAKIVEKNISNESLLGWLKKNK